MEFNDKKNLASLCFFFFFFFLVFNFRILLIQNAPEKIHPISPPSPVLVVRHHNLPQNNQMPPLMSTNGGSNYNRSMAQSQCVANIENNPLNYERDWQLDDSSQSSFKPCPQGSGSMTPLPFHDSAHTMYEANSQLRSVHSSMDGSGLDLNQIPNSAQVMPLMGGTSSNTIASTSNPGHKTEYGLFKVHSSGQHRGSSQHHYPTSSVFLENSDILDDKDYPKLYHRHSAIMMAPDSISCDSDAKLRRYSDTKLLHTANNDDDDDDCDLYMSEAYDNQPMPIFNVATVLGASIPTNNMNETHPENYQITDIIFDSNTNTYDPLELNIQEMLELDMATSRSGLRKPRHSMNNVADGVDEKCNVHYSDAGNNSTNTTPYVNNPENRNMFKSMPNLSASSENLLQK